MPNSASFSMTRWVASACDFFSSSGFLACFSPRSSSAFFMVDAVLSAAERTDDGAGSSSFAAGYAAGYALPTGDASDFGGVTGGGHGACGGGVPKTATPASRGVARLGVPPCDEAGADQGLGGSGPPASTMAGGVNRRGVPVPIARGVDDGRGVAAAAAATAAADAGRGGRGVVASRGVGPLDEFGPAGPGAGVGTSLLAARDGTSLLAATPPGAELRGVAAGPLLSFRAVVGGSVTVRTSGAPSGCFAAALLALHSRITGRWVKMRLSSSLSSLVREPTRCERSCLGALTTCLRSSNNDSSEPLCVSNLSFVASMRSRLHRCTVA